ncbi:hypothetical protein ACS5PU_08720 [Pedobacter sp. GSP4]|uniref:hypothetical protein n=1 Tax=Pedobacter sp. GSP4 TaxID=3453716 RepID=UPI003EE95D4F
MKFEIKQLPFLYQSDYRNMAWEHEHYGFFIDPKGRKYKYRRSEDYQYQNNSNWNEFSVNYKFTEEYQQFTSSDCGIMSANDLFENLNNCVEVKPWFKFLRRRNPITQIMIDDLMQSKVKNGVGHGCTDSGILRNYVIVYDQENAIYKRILLSSYGEFRQENESKYTSTILKACGGVRA